MTTLDTAREAARELLFAHTGDRSPQWRTAFTDTDGGEYPDAIAPVCTNDDHDPDDPTVYDCCPEPVIVVESHLHEIGAYLVELLNADGGDQP